MQRFVTVFLSFLFIGSTCLGCNYLEADDECYPTEHFSACSDFNDRLDECDSYTFPNIPGCYVYEDCTDNADVEEKGVDGDTDSSTDSDTGEDATNKTCVYSCMGEPVPCEVMSEEVCGDATQCAWWNDPNNIDKDLE